MGSRKGIGVILRDIEMFSEVKERYRFEGVLVKGV